MQLLLGAQVHCENADALVDAQERVFASGVTGPEGHYLSRPAVFEVNGEHAKGDVKLLTCLEPVKVAPSNDTFCI